MHTIGWYKPGKRFVAIDKMSRVRYTLTAKYGKLDFPAELSPQQMLRMGVFEGKYLTDCRGEFPKEWFERAKLSPKRPDPSLNEFGVKSRQSLQTWRKNGWIPVAPGDPDVRGWFQWYCRYFVGRRIPDIDLIQIGRWRRFSRHRAQVVASVGRSRDPPKTRAEKRSHRPKQRQALLQWAYNPFRP